VGDIKGGAFAIYATGIAEMLVVVGLPVALGITFFTLAASAFALTSLDTACRLARYSLQELSKCEGFDKVPGLGNRYVATGVTLVFAGALLFSGQFSQIWPMFGAANQLVAGLALLAVAAWMANQKRSYWFAVVPMIWMLGVTLSALGIMFQLRLSQGNWTLTIIAGVLFILAIVLAWMGFQILTGRKKAPEPAPMAGGSGEEE
jgi:carbon starvation protein